MLIAFGSRPFHISVHWKPHVLRISEMRHALMPVSWEMHSSCLRLWILRWHKHTRVQTNTTTLSVLTSIDPEMMCDCVEVFGFRNLPCLASFCTKIHWSRYQRQRRRAMPSQRFFQNLLAVLENQVKDLHLLFLCCSVFWGLRRRLQQWILGRQKHVACF